MKTANTKTAGALVAAKDAAKIQAYLDNREISPIASDIGSLIKSLADTHAKGRLSGALSPAVRIRRTGRRRLSAMTFISNHSWHDRQLVEAIANFYDFSIVIEDSAENIFGDPMPECFALYAPEQENMKEKLENFNMGYTHALSIIRRALKNAGVTDADLNGREPYLFCEDEYFPGLEVDYAKAADEKY